MEHLNVLNEIADNIGWIKINRPKKLNALNQHLIAELHNVLSEFKNTNSVKAVVITGCGEKAFVAGADISEFQNYSKEEAYQLTHNGQQLLFDFIAQFDKPVIAAINGYALGGGLELALACHLRISAPHSKFGFPEVSLGLIPGYGGTQRLPQLVGKGHAMEMILSAEMINAKTALRWGLINRVVTENSDLLTEAASMAGKLIQKSPFAIACAITAINASFGSNRGYEVEKQEFSRCFDSPEFKEGVAAFLQKRKPNF